MIKKISAIGLLAGVVLVLFFQSSCKWFKKEDKPTIADTTQLTTSAPTTTQLPHADTSIIPVLSNILDEAFTASKAKDYAKLGSLIVYRGNDMNRYGYDVFNTKNSTERKVVSITAEVFNKWNAGVENRDYARVFSLSQPDGRTLPVMEVLFVSKKNMHRKFFGFLEINGELKIADVTSNL